VKVLALGADKGGCFFYRIKSPVGAAAKLGVETEITDDIEVEGSEDTRTGEVKITEVKTDADLIIFQRPLKRGFTEVIKQAKRQGIATVVELDDDFENVSRYNAAYEYMHQKDSNYKWVQSACAEADHVSVSTPALTRYAPHGRVSVLRNYVPEAIFKVTPRYDRNIASPLTVGWSGTTATHPNDLQETKGAVGQIAKQKGLSFRVAGNMRDVAPFLRLDKDTLLSETGWVPVEDFYEAVADSMDIGIVPLEKGLFNEAKSALKGLEMASLGIPFVASPTREYERLEAYGVGKIARTPSDWRRFIGRWADNSDRLLQDARKYRDIMESEFTYEQHAHEWVTAWERAVDYRKSQL